MQHFLMVFLDIPQRDITLRKELKKKVGSKLLMRETKVLLIGLKIVQLIKIKSIF